MTWLLGAGGDNEKRKNTRAAAAGAGAGGVNVDPTQLETIRVEFYDVNVSGEVRKKTTKGRGAPAAVSGVH